MVKTPCHGIIHGSYAILIQIQLRCKQGVVAMAQQPKSLFRLRAPYERKQLTLTRNECSWQLARIRAPTNCKASSLPKSRSLLNPNLVETCRGGPGSLTPPQAQGHFKPHSNPSCEALQRQPVCQHGLYSSVSRQTGSQIRGSC